MKNENPDKYSSLRLKSAQTDFDLILMKKEIGSRFTYVDSVLINLSVTRTNFSAHSVLYFSWPAEDSPAFKRKCVPIASRGQIPHALSDTHLEFHLLSLLGVDSHNMLVVSECVSAVLLLCCHVSLQSLQHTLWLEDRGGRVRKCQTLR